MTPSQNGGSSHEAGTATSRNTWSSAGKHRERWPSGRVSLGEGRLTWAEQRKKEPKGASIFTPGVNYTCIFFLVQQVHT